MGHTALPMIQRCAERQWAGLSEAQQRSAARAPNGFGGFVRPQIVHAIWTIKGRFGEFTELVLIAVKEEMG